MRLLSVMCAAIYICNSGTLLKITAEILLAIEGNTFFSQSSAASGYIIGSSFVFPSFFFHNPLQILLYISSLYIKSLSYNINAMEIRHNITK